MTKVVGAVLFVICSTVTSAQRPDQNVCTLSSFTNGQIVTVHGKIVHGSHDMTLDITNCERVVLTYADDPNFSHTASATSINVPHETRVDNRTALQLLRDREFRRFEKYVGANYKGTNRRPCMECYKYEVEATFRGRLDVSRKVGLTIDEQTHNIVSMDGFGHPRPFTRYRLVIGSVSDVVARKLPR